MPSISAINEQLKKVNNEIHAMFLYMDGLPVDAYETAARAVRSLCQAQRSLVETQVAIFIEATEAGLDMPTLPLFVEEREDEDGEPEPAEGPGENFS